MRPASGDSSQAGVDPSSSVSTWQVSSTDGRAGRGRDAGIVRVERRQRVRVDAGGQFEQCGSAAPGVASGHLRSMAMRGGQFGVAGVVGIGQVWCRLERVVVVGLVVDGLDKQGEVQVVVLAVHRPGPVRPRRRYQPVVSHRGAFTTGLTCGKDFVDQDVDLPHQVVGLERDVVQGKVSHQVIDAVATGPVDPTDRRDDGADLRPRQPGFAEGPPGRRHADQV